MIDNLKNLLGHPVIELCDRGNSAIEASFRSAMRLSSRKKVLIPDQGGWISYEKIPPKLGLDIVRVKTNDGLIDLDDLALKAQDALLFIFAEPAGYFVYNQLDKIYSICKAKGCVVIGDATGSIGDSFEGNFVDIAVGSFGRWKPLDFGKGGFISFAQLDFYEKCKDLFPLKKADSYDGLNEKIKGLEKRYSFLHKLSRKVKDDLANFNVLFKEQDSLVVVVAFSDELEKQKILDYCDKEDLPYTLCPRYIRVLRDAISIEVKRLVEE